MRTLVQALGGRDLAAPRRLRERSRTHAESDPRGTRAPMPRRCYPERDGSRPRRVGSIRLGVAHLPGPPLGRDAAPARPRRRRPRDRGAPQPAGARRVPAAGGRAPPRRGDHRGHDRPRGERHRPRRGGGPLERTSGDRRARRPGALGLGADRAPPPAEPRAGGARPGAFAHSRTRPRGDPAPLRRVRRLLPPVPRRGDGLLLRLVPARRRVARGGAAREARARLPQAPARARRPVPRRRAADGAPSSSTPRRGTARGRWGSPSATTSSPRCGSASRSSAAVPRSTCAGKTTARSGPTAPSTRWRASA